MQARAALAAALGAAALALSACGIGGGDDDGARRERPPPSGPHRAPAPVDPPNASLAVGLTETNASLLWSSATRPDLGLLTSWRDRLQAMRPRYYRLPVDWSVLQDSPATPPDWGRPADGCMRGQPPCGAYAGLRDVLRAVRSQQQAGGGFEVMVVLYGVPPWAARGPGGCERDDIGPRSRAISDQGLDGYRALVRALLALGREEGVDLRWWSPWNEPNGPFFISPQREGCSPNSTALAPGVYTRLARAAREELDADPGDQRLIIGELADVVTPRKFGASVPEFFEALPDDVVCSAAVFAQHEYAERGEEADDPGAVAQLQRILDQRPCARDKPIWVTETGVGGAHVGDRRSGGPGVQRSDCRAMHTALRRWLRDPRVDVAFQYTFRDDPVFPVGLVDASLTRTWPAYDLWRAWGADRAPDGPAPDVPATCARRP